MDLIYNPGNHSESNDSWMAAHMRSLHRSNPRVNVLRAANALREVEDALVDLKSQAKSRAALEQALASSRDTLRISQERYDKGLSSYLEVVEADRTVLNVQLVLAQNDANQRITLAALAKALGGGWSGK